MQDIGRDLGARYILEGSVRRSGERARITAQLIDAMTGHHVWAERFDRNIDDVFAVQDEITRNIAIALQVQFSTGQHARIWQSGTESFEAWQWQIRGMSAFYRSTRQGFTEAAECFEKAIEIDPEYLAGRTALGYTHSSLARYADDATHSLSRAEEIAESLLDYPRVQSDALCLLGHIRLTQSRHEEAVAACTKAVEVAPNNSDHRGQLATKLIYSSESKRALEQLNLGIKLSARYPNWFTTLMFFGHYLQGDFQRAREVAEQAVRRFTDFPYAYVSLAGIYSVLGLHDEARKATGQLLEMQPDFSLKKYERSQRFKDTTELQTWVDHLRSAGVPD